RGRQLQRRPRRWPNRSAAESAHTLRALADAIEERALRRSMETDGRTRMDDAPILICYDGSPDSDRAIEAAAALLGPRRAVVVDIGPVLTAAESVAALSSVVPGTAFDDLNTDSALEKARAGVERARKAGFDAEPRAELAEPFWQGIVDVADEIDA